MTSSGKPPAFPSKGKAPRLTTPLVFWSVPMLKKRPEF